MYADLCVGLIFPLPFQSIKLLPLKAFFGRRLLTLLAAAAAAFELDAQTNTHTHTHAA